MDYFSIIKHLLVSIIMILCLCTMPLNSNIDVCVKSNIMFQHVCFVHEFQIVLRYLALLNVCVIWKECCIIITIIISKL